MEFWRMLMAPLIMVQLWNCSMLWAFKNWLAGSPLHTVTSSRQLASTAYMLDLEITTMAMEYIRDLCHYNKAMSAPLSHSLILTLVTQTALAARYSVTTHPVSPNTAPLSTVSNTRPIWYHEMLYTQHMTSLHLSNSFVFNELITATTTHKLLG